MAAPPHAVPAADDEQRADPGGENTAPDGDWPVSPEYRVAPDQEPEPPQRLLDERGAVAVETRPRQRLGGRSPAPIAAIIVILVAAGSALAWIVLRPDGSRSADLPPPMAGRLTTVPTVTGMKVAAARKALEVRGLKVIVRREQSSRTSGLVLSQHPAAGRMLAEGDSVRLVAAAPRPQDERTSGTARPIGVPEVIGLEVADAVREIRTAGLRARIHLIPSSRADGTVIGQVPAATEKVEPGSVVVLDVAKPQQTTPTSAAKVVVPRLVGATVAEAETQLRRLGLRWTTSEVASGRPEGTVVGQRPTSGAQVAKRQSVELRISSGAPRATVPDVIGLDEQSAGEQLAAAGFDVQVVEEPTSDEAQNGVVIDQDPRVGSDASSGSVVTITVARLA
jgi:eukaryotic-like serine/threonine-protein kinase